MAKEKFPTFAIILLVSGIIWGLQELNFFSTDIPWFPAILIVIAIGMIANRYSR